MVVFFKSVLSQVWTEGSQKHRASNIRLPALRVRAQVGEDLEGPLQWQQTPEKGALPSSEGEGCQQELIVFLNAT